MPPVTFYTAPGQNAFTTATRVDGPTPEYPIKRNLSAVFWRETWWQTEADYTPLALDTAHGTIAGAYLVSEENHARVGGGVLSWTRVYATVPSAWNDFVTVSYQFPGYKWNTGDGFVDRGEPRSISVPCRVLHEYFLCKTGQTYETPEDIPVIERQRYILTYGDEGVSDVDYVLINSDPGPTGFLTTPSGAAYDALVTAGTEIVAEDSYLENHGGNIWCRITKYVVAR